ncbi:hypothetical protein DRH29_04225 [candidate division Kazan bacterium]|uniref:Uncharacterized protein n=1 Tax=candidate division Kazan bacterium TaxID=2202143 RepID=A0A420ZC31_UNCK3|nr:MAG: hypothetical protein DRH29_04225 [candidate division Kazan bacterium]
MQSVKLWNPGEPGGFLVVLKPRTKFRRWPIWCGIKILLHCSNWHCKMWVNVLLGTPWKRR